MEHGHWIFLIGVTVGVLFSLFALFPMMVRRVIMRGIREHHGKTFVEEIEGEIYKIEIRKE